MKLHSTLFLALLVGISTCNGLANKNENIHVQNIKTKIFHLERLLDNKLYDLVDSNVDESLAFNESGTDFEIRIKLKLKENPEKQKANGTDERIPVEMVAVKEPFIEEQPVNNSSIKLLTVAEFVKNST